MSSQLPVSLLTLEDWVDPFPRHWHEEWSIAVIKQGVNRYWLRGAWHEAPPGTILVLHPGEIHDGGLSPDGWAERMTYVPEGVMETLALACSERRQPLMFRESAIHDDELAGELSAMHGMLSRDAAVDPLQGDELLIRAVGKLLERYGSLRIGDRQRGENAAVRRAEGFIRQHASSRILLSEVADAAGMSQYHLIREFRKQLGMTPHAYLKQLRITLAQDLLRKDDSLADVALAAGFFDQAHLTREFRRTLGLTPGAFRAAQLSVGRR